MLTFKAALVMVGVLRNYCSSWNINQGHWNIPPPRPPLKLNTIFEHFKDEENIPFVYVWDNAFPLS